MAQYFLSLLRARQLLQNLLDVIFRGVKTDPFDRCLRQLLPESLTTGVRECNVRLLQEKVETSVAS